MSEQERHRYASDCASIAKHPWVYDCVYALAIEIITRVIKRYPNVKYDGYKLYVN